MNGGARRMPLLVTLFAVLLLVGVVAVASSGSTPTGSSDARAPSDVVFDTLFTLWLFGLVLGAVILAYGLTQWRDVAREMASGKYRRASFAGFAVFMLLLTLGGYFRLRDWKSPEFVDEIGEPAFPTGPGTERSPAPPSSRQYEPELAWLPLLVIVGLAALGVAAYVLAARRRDQALFPQESDVAVDLAAVLDDTLDDLRAEPDPRRAVIAAYARLERALAASGLPRRHPETPEEYVHRILAALEVDSVAVRTLTDLFTRAKFSQHTVDETMREAAIGALEQIRDDLRAAARRREEERERAAMAPERAAAS